MDQLPRVDFYDAIDGSSASETRLPQSDVERMRAMWTKDKTVSQRNRRRKAACFKTHRDMLKAHAEDGVTRTVNGTGHTGPSEFCATSI